jgi:hypothetical protein
VAHPRDPDVLLATVSDGPHGADVHAGLYRTENAGRSWEHVVRGFPASSPRNIDTFHVALDPEGLAWACVDATLYVSHDRGVTWTVRWVAPEPIHMLNCPTC